MKAINLVPGDQRRGSSQSRTGGAVYAVLGAMGLVVVLLLAWVLVANQVTGRKADLERLQAETAEAERQSAELKPYRDFARLRESRYQTVESLAASRFDWAPVMRKVAFVLPRDVWLSSVQGTVAPDTEPEDASGGEASSLRGAVEAPALEVVGCAREQSEVARTMARLRLINGVRRVTLAVSEKGDSGPAGSTGGGGTGGDDCRGGRGGIPKFDILAFFDPSSLGTASGAQGARPSTGAPGQSGTGQSGAGQTTSTASTPGGGAG